MARKQEHTADEVAEALRDTMGLAMPAAKRLGCSHTTVLNYLRRYPSLQKVQAECREGFVDQAEAKLSQAVKNGEPWAIALVVKTLGKHRGYVERMEQTGAEGGPVRHSMEVDLSGFSDDELRSIVGRIRGAGGAPAGERAPLRLRPPGLPELPDGEAS